MRIPIAAMAGLLAAVGGTLAHAQGAPPPPTPPSGAPVFFFETDEFWLNLHHFLYVLGRAEAKARDSGREAVVHAPEDAQRGLAALSEEEREAWAESVRAYAEGPSRMDAVFDPTLAATTLALTRVHGDAPLPAGGIDPAARAALERAAPAYRKGWWPAHRQGNRDWLLPMQDLLERHGPDIFQYILRAYRMPWPKEGYEVHLSAYANWAGAYSTEGDLLVVSTNSKGTRGLHGLEIVFHESMHQWDGEMDAVLEEQAQRVGKPVPRNLSHALVFFTAGEAVRKAVPQHVPYAEAFKVWERGLQPMKAALLEVWKPYLEGKGTRDEAIAAMIARLGDGPAPRTP